MKYIIDMPDSWKHDCGTCPHTEHNGDEEHGTEETIYYCQADYENCPLASAKKAVEVKFDTDKDTGLSVIDEKGVFHFEGQDKYYAVEDK